MKLNLAKCVLNGIIKYIVNVLKLKNNVRNLMMEHWCLMKHTVERFYKMELEEILNRTYSYFMLYHASLHATTDRNVILFSLGRRQGIIWPPIKLLHIKSTYFFLKTGLKMNSFEMELSVLRLTFHELPKVYRYSFKEEKLQLLIVYVISEWESIHHGMKMFFPFLTNMWFLNF